ncbi:MAG: hypothetical protein ACI4P0_02870 [Mailhella sp.]
MEYILIEPLPKLAPVERTYGYLARKCEHIRDAAFVRVRYGAEDVNYATAGQSGVPARNTTLLFASQEKYRSLRTQIAEAFAMSVVVETGTEALHLYSLGDEALLEKLLFLTQKFYLVIPCCLGTSERTPLPCGGIYRTKDGYGPRADFTINMDLFTGVIDIFVAGEALSAGHNGFGWIKKYYLDDLVLNTEGNLFGKYATGSPAAQVKAMHEEICRRHALAAEEMF